MNWSKIRQFILIVTITFITIIITVVFDGQNAVTASNYKLKDLGSQYRVHVIGNSFIAKQNFSQKLRRHVQQAVEDLAVSPNGICYTNAVWDERFAQASVYQNGDQTAIFEEMMGWGRNGGYAIAVDDRNKYVYVGIKAKNINRQDTNQYDNPVYPKPESVWYGFRRYHARTGKIAPFPQGYGKEAGVIVVNTNDGAIHGLTVHQDRLYVSDTFNNQIKVYELNNLSQKPIDIWKVEHPGKLAFDAGDNLWAVDWESDRVISFDRNGRPRLETINLGSGAVASDLAIDTKRDLLYVTDIGIEQNVKIYDISSKPTLQKTFGTEKGIFAEVAGQRQALKLHNPKGIGIDNRGSIYIAQNASSSVSGGGVIIGSYQPNGNLRWQVSSSEFMSGLTIDPKNESILYSKERIYDWNTDKRLHIATTLDPFNFPEDPRLQQDFTNVQVLEINNKKLLFLTERNGGSLAVFRFQPETHGEIAIPYAMFATSNLPLHELNHQKINKQWIWIDANLNGKFDSEEFSFSADESHRSKDWFVSSNGELWSIAGKSIYQFLPIIQDEQNYPQWNFNTVKQFNLPSTFTKIRRIAYDSTIDSLYLTGYTEDAPDLTKSWKAIGKKIARFDNWKAVPQLKWIKDTPWQTNSKEGRQKPIAFDIEGDYIFVGIEATGKQKDPFEHSTVLVYTKENGGYIGSMQQKEAIGPIMFDKAQGLNVKRTSNGNYLVFLEDAAFARSIVFQWTPN